MAGDEANNDNPPHRHIELVDDNDIENKNAAEPSPALTNGKGWDGKLRVSGRASLANPEALSDPEYSDEDNVLPGGEIQADEGKHLVQHSLTTSSPISIVLAVKRRNSDM